MALPYTNDQAGQVSLSPAKYLNYHNLQSSSDLALKHQTENQSVEFPSYYNTIEIEKWKREVR